MSNPSFAQAISLLTRVNDKGLSLKRLEAHFEAGLLSDLLDVDPKKVNRADYRKVIGHPAQTAVTPAVPTQKFDLLADLGVIEVPQNYVHATHLDLFGKVNREKFHYYNDAITDANFPNPSRVLKPGDKLHVRVFKQIVPGATTSKERMAFLAEQKAVHTGAQGVSLVWEQRREELPKGYWYASFDEKEQLWAGADGRRGVPVVYADSDGDFRFVLGGFESAWDGDFAFLCFCELPLGA